MGHRFEYEIDLLSTDEQLDFTKLLGHPMLVVLDLPDNQVREFSGVVARFVLVGSLGRYVRYRATLRPWLWLLTRRSNCRIFQKQTVPQVIMALFREHQFSDFEDKLSPGYRQWEYLVQYRESDKLRFEAELAQHDIVRGEGNARGIQAGALFSMIDFPRADQNKEYLVCSTSISIRARGYESVIDAVSEREEPTFRVSFGAIEAKRNFRVVRTTPEPVVRAPQTAVVVGQSGQEIWTDQYGRVKVQFRWDRRQGFDEDSSCWVRVAQIWAGSGWGGLHTPRIGQEVIVDFLEGNPDRLCWLLSSSRSPQATLR